jgi:hypothetical protein
MAKIMKKTLSVLLVIMMLLGFMPAVQVFSMSTPARAEDVSGDGGDEAGNAYKSADDTAALTSSGDSGGVSLMFTISIPEVETTAAESVTSTSATLGGNVTSDGGSAVTLRGIVYSSAHIMPEIETDSEFHISSGSGIFSDTLSGLAAGTKYYVRAFATNTSGTGYGSVVEFTTLALPTVSGISPSSGSTAGGTNVTITGTNFTGATAVKFGSTDASSFTISSATTITATSPAGTAGVVDISVITPGGTSAASAGSKFTYDSTAPTLSDPSASDITDTTAKISFTSDEAGTYYYVLYPAASTAPSDADAVKTAALAADPDLSGAALAAANSVSLSGLTASTAYKAYVMVEDSEGSKSQVSAIEFTTTDGSIPLSSGTMTIESGKTYTIGSVAELNNFSTLVNGGKSFSGSTVKLLNDIILGYFIDGDNDGIEDDGEIFNAESGGTAYTSSNFTPIGSFNKNFKGVFDGQGYKIRGIYISQDTSDDMGLFGFVYDATVKNVGVADSYIKGNTRIAGIAANATNSVITNCYNDGSVSGNVNNVGGIAGYNQYSTVENCCNTGSISLTGPDNSTIGGIAGNNNTSTIRNCYNTGSISGKYSIGGIAGRNSASTIESCYNIGSISGTITGNSYIGGICGTNTSTISTCYNAGSISGYSYIGGICGNNTSSISACYNTGSVSGQYHPGGVAGRNTSTITGCYYDKQLCPVGGIDGSDTTEAAGKLTSELTDSAFAGLSTGWIKTNNLYPRLTGMDTTSAAYVSASSIFLAASETAAEAKVNFTLSTSNNVVWSSPNTDTISISGTNASVIKTGDVTLNASLGGVSKSVALKLIGDDTAPLLNQSSATYITQTTAKLNFTSNETGTYYYVVYLASAAAPLNATALKTAAGSNNGAVTANTAKSVDITGLTASTAYKAYVMVEDAAGNKSAVTTISFTTNTAPVVDTNSTLNLLEDVANASLKNYLKYTDADSDPITYTVTSAPAKGAIKKSGTSVSSFTQADIDGGAVTFTPEKDFNGSDSFKFTVSDGNVTTAEQTFTITVTAVNDAPGFTKGDDRTVLEDSGAQSIAGWATAISKGPADENGQTLTFDVTNNNNSLFSEQPAIDAAGKLTYTPAPDKNGSATVTVTLHDDGGTANGGSDTSASQTFTITVTAVNDAPTISSGTAVEFNENE